MRTTAERTCLVVVSLTLLGVTSSARAEDIPFGVRATPRVVPQSAEDLAIGPRPPSAAGTAKTHTFFLNYDGASVKSGFDDNSATDTSMFQEFAGNYAPYGDGAKRAASFQAVLTDWAPYDVIITDKRPNGVYTMCINTPDNIYGNGSGVLGVAPLDCNDSNGANIVFAFHSDNDQFPAATQATTMSQEIAHAFGLEHVSQPNDIMNPYNAGGDPKFLDQCLTLDGGNIGIQCGQQHQQFCGGNQQNSHKELIWLFGESSPDTTAPTVQITSPADGAMFNAGAGFVITATATDDVAVSAVDLFNNGEFLQSDSTEPFSWDVQSIPAGNYCFKATARDLANNTADSNQVCVTVVEGSDPDPTTDPTTDPTNGTDPTTDPQGTDSNGDSLGGSDDTGVGSNGEESGGDSVPTSDGDSVSGGSLPGLPPDYGEDEDGGCRVAPPVPTASLVILALLGLGRRRRR